MEVEEGAALMFVERVAYDQSGMPIELSREPFRGNCTRMIVWSSETRSHFMGSGAAIESVKNDHSGALFLNANVGLPARCRAALG